MSERQIFSASTAASGSDRDAQVRSAIARAAKATGVDFQFLMAQAKIESGMDPNARAGTSSAAGLYQFTNSTWLGMLDRHGDEHGLGWASGAINGSRVADPAMRQQLLQLRYNPDAAASMAAELAVENRASLQGVLGREPDSAELYLAHFMGQGGASRFLGALAASPGASAPSLFPQEAAANRAIFYDNGVPRTVSGVMDLLRSKVTQAMRGVSRDAEDFSGGFGAASDFSTAASLWAKRADPRGYGQNAVVPAPAPHIEYEPVTGPIAAQFQAASVGAAQSAQPMSETLRGAFGGSSGAGATGLPTQIAAAYARLSKLGL